MLVDKKNDEIKFNILRRINEEYISVTNGCTRFIDSYRFLYDLVKTLDSDDFN